MALSSGDQIGLARRQLHVPDAEPGRLDGEAQQLLALAQRLLGVLAFLDIGDGADPLGMAPFSSRKARPRGLAQR